MFNYDYVPPENMLLMATDLKQGECTFFIKEVQTTDNFGNPLTSQTGASKINIMVELTDVAQQKAIVYDSVSTKMAYRLKAWLDAVGMPELYNRNARLDEQKLVGQRGKCVLGMGTKIDGSAKVVITKLHAKQLNAHASSYIPPNQDHSNRFADDGVPF